ncbi:lamin tail domain-containing protein, partial [Actinoplanes philippinensis]|uniref:lamin tail domain-containing protein n=1 Tax=Actinoplanes philippinensis TaxID=35752 RepID=UPI0034038150
MLRTLPGVVTVALGSVLSVAVPAHAAPALRFQSVQYDSPGRDDRSNGSLNAEWIALVNTGPAAVNLNGWRIADAVRSYTLRDVTIAGRGGVVYPHQLTRDPVHDRPPQSFLVAEVVVEG